MPPRSIELSAVRSSKTPSWTRPAIERNLSSFSVSGPFVRYSFQHKTSSKVCAPRAYTRSGSGWSRRSDSSMSVLGEPLSSGGSIPSRGGADISTRIALKVSCSRPSRYCRRRVRSSCCTPRPSAPRACQALNPLTSKLPVPAMAPTHAATTVHPLMRTVSQPIRLRVGTWGELPRRTGRLFAHCAPWLAGPRARLFGCDMTSTAPAGWTVGGRRSARCDRRELPHPTALDARVIVSVMLRLREPSPVARQSFSTPRRVLTRRAITRTPLGDLDHRRSLRPHYPRTGQRLGRSARNNARTVKDVSKGHTNAKEAPPD